MTPGVAFKINGLSTLSGLLNALPLSPEVHFTTALQAHAH